MTVWSAELLVPVGQTVAVGAPLATLAGGR